MKKIITSCILSMLMLAGAVKAGDHNTINVNPVPAASYSVWVKIIISFHRPKLQCLKGFGICVDFEFGTSQPTTTGPELCPALARINSAGQLELKVTEDDLLKYDNASALPYFKSGTFTLDDDYTFSDRVTKLLVSDHLITVKQGHYRVSYDALAHTYTVTFPV